VRAPAGWDAGRKGYVDPFAGDKVLFTITKANAAQYKDKLTPGTLAMLDKYDNFKMNVYQTRRTACYPQAVYDNVKAQAGKVELQGFGIANRGPSTVPFPIPKSGLEAIWNHTMRYLGGGIDRNYHSFPCARTATSTRSARRNTASSTRTWTSRRTTCCSASVALHGAGDARGTVFLVHEPVDQVKQARSRGSTTPASAAVAARARPRLRQHQRRHRGPAHHRPVRRLQRCARPLRLEDRRKKEIYFTYNAFKLSDKKLRYKETDPQEHAERRPAALRTAPGVGGRANLEGGQQARVRQARVLIDEDTWTVLYEDAYDHAASSCGA